MQISYIVWNKELNWIELNWIPYLRMDQHKLVGEKANTKSNQAEKEL